MEQYLVDLFVTSAQEQVRAPAWLLRLYLSLFSPPLGKTLRLDMIKMMLRGQDLEGKRVLDVGCGIGDLSFILTACGAHVTGVELDPQKVSQATSIAKRWHFEGLHFLAADVTKLDQMNLGQFDAIFCIALLEHIQDDRVLLHQLQGMLRPGGIFVLEVPSALRKTIAEVEAADGHVRPGYTFEDVPALLEDVGFHVKKRCSMDPLGLTYYWFVCSRFIPVRIVQRWLFAALGPLFIPLIRLTSALIKRPGYELCFLAVKD
jgi:SAM-dependent methyltransferase